MGDQTPPPSPFPFTPEVALETLVTLIHVQAGKSPLVQTAPVFTAS